jgi:hypothetical protein
LSPSFFRRQGSFSKKESDDDEADDTSQASGSMRRRKLMRYSSFDLGVVERLKSQHVIGAWMLDIDEGFTDAEVMKQQHLMQTLYESRLASLQRLVAFMVLFWKMGKFVQDFWPLVSFGMLGCPSRRAPNAENRCGGRKRAAHHSPALALCVCLAWQMTCPARSRSCVSPPLPHLSPVARCATA